jgi:hypothetical protein
MCTFSTTSSRQPGTVTHQRGMRMRSGRGVGWVVGFIQLRDQLSKLLAAFTKYFRSRMEDMWRLQNYRWTQLKEDVSPAPSLPTGARPVRSRTLTA